MTIFAKPNVCIIESLDFLQEDSLKEGEIISRTLRMADKQPHYSYVRSKRELKALVKEFGESKRYRYLHISCHGNKESFFTTLDPISTDEMVDLLVPHLGGRRLFLSCCLAGDGDFAEKLIKKSGCVSVIAPRSTIYFHDAAIFCSAFYHLMFKADASGMNNKVMQEKLVKCALLVDQKFNYYAKSGDTVLKRLLPITRPKIRTFTKK